MKKQFKRICALLLCAMTLLCCIPSAWAAEAKSNADIPLTPFDSKQGKVTIKINSDDETNVTAIKAMILRIIRVEVQEVDSRTTDSKLYQPAEPVYKWADGVKEWVANHTKYGKYVVDGSTDYAVSEDFLKLYAENMLTTPNTEYDNFIAALGAAIINGEDGIAFEKNDDGTIKEDSVEGKPLVKSKSFGSDGTTTIDGLSKGSYIVLVKGGSRIYQPVVVNFIPHWKAASSDDSVAPGWYVTNNITRNVKSSPISITKQISKVVPTNDDSVYSDKTTAAYDDRLYFKIEADVPKYLNTAVSKKFIIKDELTQGLEWDIKDLKVEGLTKSEDGYVASALAESTDYSIKYNSANKTFEISFEDYDTTVSQYDKVRITYNTRVTDEAKLVEAIDEKGNENVASLTYSNNQYLYNNETSINASSTIYTYGLDLTKQNVNDDKLGGAVFEIYNVNESGEKTGDPIKFVDNGNGLYKKAFGTKETTTKLTTVDGGKLKLNGLDIGKYQVVEVKAPDEYVILKSPVPFEIKDNKENALNGKPEYSNPTVEANDGYVPLTVTNVKGVQLPVTGGMGTILFTAGGAALVIGALALLLIANRKKSRKS